MKRKILLIVLLLAFVGYAGWSFADSVTPYVGIKEAKAATSSNVQVKGLLAKMHLHRIWKAMILSSRCRMKRRGDAACSLSRHEAGPI